MNDRPAKPMPRWATGAWNFAGQEPGMMELLHPTSITGLFDD